MSPGTKVILFAVDLHVFPACKYELHAKHVPGRLAISHGDRAMAEQGSQTHSITQKEGRDCATRFAEY